MAVVTNTPVAVRLPDAAQAVKEGIMTRRLLAAAALVAATAFVALGGVGRQGGATAAQAEVGATGTPVTVSAAGCIYFGTGQRTVPAGSTIVVRSGWSSGVEGAVRSFLNAQVSILSVNDGAMLDVSSYHRAPEPFGPGWVSWLDYPTGVTLTNVGDSMRFTFTLYYTRGVADVYDADGDGSRDPVTPAGPGLGYGGTCTVTAV